MMAIPSPSKSLPIPCSFFGCCPISPYLGAVTALLPPPRLSRAVPTTGQVSGHHTITTTGYFVVLVPPLTGGTTTLVSGGTITVQAVAVVIYNYILRWRRWSLGTSVTTSNHSHPKQPKQYRTSSSIFSTTRV